MAIDLSHKIYIPSSRFIIACYTSDFKKNTTVDVKNESIDFMIQ